MRLPTLLLAGLAVAGFWLYGCERENAGELRQRIRAREAVIATLAKQHRTDTLRLVRTRHTTDSILLTDTVWSTDTVVKLVQAERNACDALVGTCEREKATLREQIADIKRQQRGFRFLGIPLGCAAGGVVSDKGVRPGVGCGVRF